MICTKFVSRISVGIFLLQAVTAWTAPPTVMNFQGILTDGSGSPLPSVSKSVDFTIYDGPASGANVVWGPETRTVNTDASGRFGVLLGEVSPITQSVFSGSERYLGIKVEADSEIVPRARITTAGYAHRVSTVDGASGGNIIGDVTLQSGLNADWAYLGDFNTQGILNLDNGDGTLGATLFGTQGGGEFYLYDAVYHPTIAMGDWGGPGEGVLYIYGDENQYTGIGMAGDVSGDDNPAFVLAGSNNWTNFDMSMSGDATVELPDSAISSWEIKDEPGIASNLEGNIENLPKGGAMMDLLTVSITTPAGGYVTVEGKCYVILYGFAGQNYALIQIDTLSGGAEEYPWYQLAGSDGFPNTSGYVFPVYVTRTYYSDTARSYTIVLEGVQYTEDTLVGVAQSWDHMLTATYYPSSYGSVVSAVAADQVSRFQSAVPIPQRETKGIIASTAQPTYQVDLRDLELRAAKTRAEAEKAQKELLLAKFKAQMEKNRTSIPKPEQKQ